ncbi:MAG TPA: alpha-keto acid decarboxylase family protein [Tissierellia bacterium]|nr:alpha-keto acid decarboxylase family protein [Tissierellia bacterium]
MKITIGDYLIKRLKEIGIRHIIGVPGDFNLQFLEQVGAADGIEFVGASNELNAAYAADGYARENGIAALSITYGVGDLGAIGGVAGSAAEHVPVIVLSGAPPLYIMKHNYPVHHSLGEGDFSDMARAYQQFTVGQGLITHENAADEIDRLLRLALRHQMPVNLQIPSNLTYLYIDVSDEPLRPVSHQSDQERLRAAVSAMRQLFSAAKQPAVLIDMDVDRFGIESELLAFIEATRTPFAALSTGKAILDENHPLYRGIYQGDDSEPGAQALIEQADFLLTVAPRFIEWNSGSFSAELPEATTIYLGRNHVKIGTEAFEAVALKDVLDQFLDRLPSKHQPQTEPEPAEPGFDLEADKPLAHDKLWKQLRPFFRAGDLIYAETGTASQAMGSLKLPKDTTYIASLIWGAIGFTLPALFGSLLANPQRRQILFIGDGSFQVSAQALSRIIDRGLNPIIFVINNDGYTIERYIMGMEESYNDIPAWQYHRLPALLSAKNRMLTFHVTTQGELAQALKDIEEIDHGALIELHLHPLDAPEALKKFGPDVAAFNYGPRGPENELPEDE